MALARRGWEATVVERDAPPSTDDGDAAFLVWERRSVPQFRQPHGFSARSRNLLLSYIPEVVERLVADGIEEVNFFRLLAPPDLWSEGDEAYTSLFSRRPAFELAIRRTAEVEPGVRILSPAAVAGIRTEASPGDVPRVTGLKLADGSMIDAEVVLDCGGRRTPVPKWLGAVGVDVPFEVQDCDSIYLARYYRANPTAGLSLLGLVGTATQLDRLAFIGFPGDHGTFGIAAFVLPDDEDAKVLRHDWAWDVVTPAIPALAGWVDPGHATPLTSVQYLGGHQNIRRHYVVGGRPIIHGLLPVGDSLCTTNPMYGWGASMALTYAFASVEAIDAHASDLEAMALA